MQPPPSPLGILCSMRWEEGGLFGNFGRGEGSAEEIVKDLLARGPGLSQCTRKHCRAKRASRYPSGNRGPDLGARWSQVSRSRHSNSVPRPRMGRDEGSK